MKNKYKQRTKLLGIPVPGEDDHIWPKVEMKKWQIVENILVAGMRGMKNCLFDEGDMSLELVDGDTYAVVLRATGRSASAKGVVSGFFFHAPRTVRWEPLKVGRQYYLYLSAMPKTYLDPTKVRTVVSAHSLSGRSLLPMAVVDLRGDDYSLNSQPDGKVYSASMSAPASLFTPRVVEFRSEGKEGVVLSSGGKVSFVQVSKMQIDAEESKEMGEVSVGYYNSDNKVERPDQFVVYNSGEKGVPAKALVFCEG